MKKLIAAAVAASAVIALSACGSSTDNKPSAKAKITAPTSSAAPTKSDEAVAGGPVDGQAIASKMVDAMLAKKTAHMTVTTGGATTMQGDYEFGNPVKLALKMSRQGLNMEVVQVGGVTYIKGLPGMSKPWFKLDPKGGDAFSKMMASMVDVSKSNDPRSLVSMMTGIKGRDLGMEQADGVPTNHYAFQVPLSAYGKVLSPQILKLMRGMIKGPITMGYWVGDDNLPRKMSSEMMLSGKSSKTEIAYSDWGKSVDIVAPPATQVGSAPHM